MLNSFRLIKYYTLYIANLANKVATVFEFQQYDLLLFCQQQYDQ